jgi:uncharacterized membrane protein YbaN (DUF454 family)
MDSPAQADGPESPPPSRLTRALFRVAGLGFVGIAALGVALPLLPTTPFLLLACWCFTRSSPTLHRWLVRSPVFGPFLADWQRHRGVRPHVKVTAVTLMALVGAISAASGQLPAWALALLVALLATGATVVIRLPTVRG